MEMLICPNVITCFFFVNDYLSDAKSFTHMLFKQFICSYRLDLTAS